MTHGERTRAACLESLLNTGKPIDWPQPLEAQVRTQTPQLDHEIAKARRSMGEDRWAELQAEWNSTQERMGL